MNSYPIELIAEPGDNQPLRSDDEAAVVEAVYDHIDDTVGASDDIDVGAVHVAVHDDPDGPWANATADISVAATAPDAAFDAWFWDSEFAPGGTIDAAGREWIVEAV